MASTKLHKDRKPRSKLITKKILKQVEFYFSDANLGKDRYLRKLIESSDDKSIPVDELLKFNKLKALTDDVNLVKKALKKSSLLQLNADNSKVSRVVPFVTPSQEDVDARTIYVDGFSKNITHDCLRSFFSSCGNVAYVSVPRYQSSGDPKGFAFVEFETVDAAKDAVQKFAQTFHKQDGCKFPVRGSKDIQRLQKQVDTTLYHTTHEYNPREIDDPTTKYGSHTDNENRSFTAAETSQISKTCIKQSESEMKLQSPVPLLQQQSLPLDEQLAAEKERKRGKRSKRKRSRSISSGGNSSSVSSDHQPPVKRAVTDNASGKGDTVSTIDGQQDSSKTTEIEPAQHSLDDNKADIKSVKKSKRKRKKTVSRRHTEKERELSASHLHVMSKHDWLLSRNAYLLEQKSRMKALKAQLANFSQGSDDPIKDSRPAANKKRKGETKAPCVKGLIVKILSAGNELTKELLQSLVGDIPVSYIEITGPEEGFIRFRESAKAMQFVHTSSESSDHTVSLLEGDEEVSYWKRIIELQQKHRREQRKKHRGKSKLLKRAENAEALSLHLGPPNLRVNIKQKTTEKSKVNPLNALPAAKHIKFTNDD